VYASGFNGAKLKMILLGIDFCEKGHFWLKRQLRLTGLYA
jgi:hypothetical protein